MTNFNLRLRKNVYGEWKDEYIDYEKLKRLIKQQEQKRKLQQQLQSQQQQQDPLLFPVLERTNTGVSTNNYGTASPKPMSRMGVRRSRSTSFLRTLAANANNYANNDASSEMQSLLLVTTSYDPFEDALEVEYEKVERAYLAHLAHYSEQLELLRVQFRPNAPYTTRESLKFALGELHRLLTLLNNFTLLNYKGFIKILKRHERAMTALSSSSDSSMLVRSSTSTLSSSTSFLHLGHKRALQSFQFVEARQCHDLLHRVEQTFADFFCDGIHSLAVATLMTKREEPVNWAQIYIGMKIGSCIILIVWVVWDSLVVPTFKSSRDSHVIPLAATRAYPVYRGIGCLLLLHWLVGVSLYVWRKAKINYRYIFELDPRNVQQYAQVFSDATNMTIVFLVNLLLYYKVVNGNFPEEFLHRGYYPLSLMLYAVYYYVVRDWERQRGMLRTVLEIMCSPFSSVTFFHVFVGNYLTSTIKVNQDLSWAVCYFATREFLEKDVAPEAALLLLRGGTSLNDVINSNGAGSQGCQHNFYYVNVVVPLICALPLWWRFLQNLRRIFDTKTWWPSLPNAFKYALAQVVSLFGLFHPFYIGNTGQDNAETFQIMWIVLFTLSSLYTWAWDVTMDWGLGRPEHKLRGYRQMFSRNWIYNVAVVADFFLCFAWTLSLIPHRTNDEFLLYLQPFTMVAELFRRTFWSFFCLENEHLRNTHGYRRVNFIPLHYDTSCLSDDELEPKPQVMKPLGGVALLTNISLLVCAVVGLSIAAIVFEK